MGDSQCLGERQRQKGDESEGTMVPAAEGVGMREGMLDPSGTL